MLNLGPEFLDLKWLHVLAINMGPQVGDVGTHSLSQGNVLSNLDVEDVVNSALVVEG